MVTPHLPCHCMPSSGGISGRCGAASRFWEDLASLALLSSAHGRKESQGSGAVSDAIAESTIQARRGHPTLGPMPHELRRIWKDLTKSSPASSSKPLA